MTPKFLLGGLITPIGVLVLMANKVSMSPDRLLGDSLSLCSSIFYAMFMITVYKLRDSVTSTIIMFISALVSQILGHDLLAYCLGKANACLSSLITLSQPVVTALYAWVIFNESLNLQTIIAILITLTGVYLAKTQTSTNIAQEKA